MSCFFKKEELVNLQTPVVVYRLQRFFLSSFWSLAENACWWHRHRLNESIRHMEEQFERDLQEKVFTKVSTLLLATFEVCFGMERAQNGGVIAP